MGNTVFMPKLNADMTEGVIVRWLVAQGDMVEKDDPLFEVETGKIVQEVESKYEGRVLRLYAEEGSSLPIGEEVCFIGAEGEEASGVSQAQIRGKSESAPAEPQAAEGAPPKHKVSAFDYDLVIIGAGPGGYTAAIRAAQLGAKVLLVEKDEVGGTCLNRGCIPTKSLYVRAEEWRCAQHMADTGIFAQNLSFDWGKIADAKDAVVAKLRSGVDGLLAKNGVQAARAEAKILDGHSVRVNEKNISAARILIATGTRPALPPVNCGEGVSLMTTDDVLALRQLPASMAIIGGGVVGVEFAGILASFGVKVTLIEALETLLTGLDADLVNAVNRAFKKEGIDVRCGLTVSEIRKSGGVHVLSLKGGGEVQAEAVLAAVGRKPSDEAFSALGIQRNEKGYIRVDDRMRTSEESVYAIGDITGISQLAHVASAQGVCAVENMFGNGYPMSYSVIPSCVFTLPELAAVGMTEYEASQKGIPFKSSTFKFSGNGKALAEGDTEGFVKILVDERFDEILGIHIAGKNANLLIAEGALAMAAEVTARDMACAIHAHPTRAEALMEAALGIGGAMIHG